MPCFFSADPLIIEGPSNQGVDIGGNSTMTCTVEGLPKPTQFWRRQDGRKLDLGGRVKQLPSGALFIRGESRVCLILAHSYRETCNRVMG